ncbi:MAG: hypothetical protein HY775_09790 [Acidobacteria bacterium]|nr:hypothetical protein [Acidobacteriota bacterium]
MAAKKMIALLLVLMVLALVGVTTGALANENECAGPVSVNCNVYNDDGTVKETCTVYVDLGNDPPGILCLNVPA